MTTYRPPENPRREPSFPGVTTGQLGMNIFLASLTVFFLAGILGLVVTRLQSDAWKTPGMPELPLGLVGSTALLLGQTFTFRATESALRRNELARVERGLGLALLFGLGFLGAQALNWRGMIADAAGIEVTSLYLFSFYLLTALHAAHVFGGVLSLAWVYFQATQRAYSSSRTEGLVFARQYWDFLFAVWVLLAAALWICAAV